MANVHPALAFYLRHSADVDALWTQEDCPAGVDPEDWRKFRDVIAFAGERAAELLRSIRGEVLSVLKDSILTEGRGPHPSTLAEQWDAWIWFKPRGKGNKGRVGAIGVLLEADTTGKPQLVAYVKPAEEAEAKKLIDALKTKGLLPSGDLGVWYQRGLVPLTLVPVAHDSAVETITGMCIDAFAKVRDLIAGVGA